ncbi:MAG TPA: carboxypeptidase regulatory-like domain-containing protein [Candidatus Limnocylindria bacterium]|nr:carboxypeptidase regulatory-like domain-containing protein [Candidatus Limnocylindria bacterium]
MRRFIAAGGVLLLVLLSVTIVAAQNTGQIVGEIKDLNGKPYPDVNVEIKNPDNGKVVTTKTDKQGHFTQVGLPGGLYTITLTHEKDKLNFPVQFRVVSGQDNGFNINFKEIKASQAPSAEEVKKREEEENLFKNMKQHFDNGMAALNDSTNLRTQLKTATADQKSAIQDKLNADYQTAITELRLAEQGMTPKDIRNHALVWANLGQAYEFAGHYDEAAGAFQKALELAQQAPYYEHLSTALTNAAAAQTDTKVVAAKLAEAGAACDKMATIEPTGTARCWKNMGIILSNKGKLPEAAEPLQKAAQADPKDAQTWFLLGGALSSKIDSKQQGDKLIYIIPPGTAEAYQKSIDAAPNGPYAPQAKAALDQLAALSGGEETSIGKKKKK